MQMAYNAIQGTMMRRTWSQDMTTGQLTETYAPWIEDREFINGVIHTIPHTLLADKFNGTIVLGYLTGFSYDDTKSQWTYTFDSGANFGGNAISTQNLTFETGSTLKSTVDYTDFYGQQVKVIYNTKQNDVIYGVFANDSSVVVSGATGNIEDYNDSANTVTVAGTDYKLKGDACTIGVYDVNADTAADTLDSLKPAITDEDTGANNLSAYTFKLVDNTGDGKIDVAIRTPMTIAKINYVGKDSVQLGSGVESRDIDALTTYDGYAAGDWVCFIEADHAVTGKDTIQKIDLQTAAVSGVRGGEGAADYTEYQINGEWLTASKISPYTSMVAKADVNDTIEYVALGSTIFYAKIVDIAATSKNIAMIVTVGAESGTSGLSGNTLKAKLLFADGSTSVVTVSKLGGNDVDDSDEGELQDHIGKLVTYRLNGSNYELMLVDDDNKAGYDSFVATGSPASYTATGYDDGKVNGFELADDAVVYFCTAFTANATNKSGVYTGKEIKNTWGTEAMNDPNHVTNRVQVLTQEVNGFTYAKVVLLIDTDGLPTVTTGSNYGYLSAPTFRSVETDGKTYLNYTIQTANGVINVKEENTDAPADYPQGSVITYDVVSDGVVKNVNLANVTTGMVTGWDGVEKIALDYVSTEIDASDTTIIYVDSNKKVGAEGGSIQKAADTNGDGTCDVDNVRYVLSANYVVLLLVDINNEMKGNPASSLLSTSVDTSTGSVNASDVAKALATDAGTVTLSVPAGGLTVNGNLNVPKDKTVKFTGTGTVTMNGDWTVDGTVEFTGTGTVTMNANWTVNGTVKVAGTLVLNGHNVDGSGTVTGNNIDLGSSISGKVELSFKSATLSGDFRVDGGTLTIEGSIASSGDFTITITAGTVKVTGDVKGNLNISGDAAVTTGSVTGNVTNNGTGKVNVGTVTGTIDGSGNTIYKIGKDAVAYIVNK